jgi:type IV secretion system protein VirB3/type IV secretion system protein VirB4
MRTLPIHQSLHRHAHVMGAEREVMLCICLISFIVGLGGMTLLSGFVALIFYIIGLIFARQMAKHDPLMTKVWLRHIKLQIFYTSKSGIWRKQ